jgi:hypothetical protein
VIAAFVDAGMVIRVRFVRLMRRAARVGVLGESDRVGKGESQGQREQACGLHDRFLRSNEFFEAG